VSERSGGASEQVRDQTVPSEVADRATPPPQPVDEVPLRMSRLAFSAAVLVVALAVAWILFAWRVLNAPLLDAVGEAAGAVFLGLLIVSVVGALSRSRRR
jgi:hypothetical protein